MNQEAKMLTWDTETCLIERARLAPPLVCYQHCLDTDSEGTVTHWTETRDLLVEHLESDLYMIAHNSAYDVAVIMEQFPELVPRLFDKMDRDQVGDTMLAQTLIDIAKGTYAFNYKKKGFYSLENTAARYDLEKDANDPWRLRYGELRDIPVSSWPADAIRYAAHDAEVLIPLIQKMVDKYGHYLGDLEAQTRAALCLHLASCWGVHSDPKKVSALRDEVQKLIESVKEDLINAGLVEPSGKKNQNVAKKIAWDYSMLFGIIPKWTKTGLTLNEKERTFKHISLDTDGCNILGSELLQKYSLYASQDHLKARLDDLSEGYIFPLQTRFDPIKESGRCSSTKPREPLKGTQMQNFSRKVGMRDCIIPRDGMAFLAADFSGVELHTWAQACLDLFGESALAVALNSGKDPHLLFAAKVLGVPYEEADRLKSLEDEGVLSARQEAKPCNFGFMGGMGVMRFILQCRAEWGLDISMERAKFLKNTWMNLWPEARLFFRHVQRLLAGKDYVTSKQLRVDRYRGRVGYCDLCNDFFQPPAADGTKKALWAVTKACYNGTSSPLYGYRVWNMVHDEIITEGPVDRIHEASIELSQLMERAFNSMTPDVPTEAEAYAMMYWSKKAKPRYENGRLVPWNGV